MTEERRPPLEGTVGYEAAGLGRYVVGRQSASSDPLVGRRIAEYEIRRVLGRGGMGSVYEAFHLQLHKTVAIKVLAAHLLDDPRALERFRREMRAIGRLNSPYIVQAYDASLSGEVQYIAMEFVDGVDADELVRRLHAVPVEDACEIVRQAAMGLEDAHRAQMVHRDVKPKNLAVSKNGRVKILDLGLALCKSEVMATGRLTAHAVIGSYQYMAPEQFDDSHEVDVRADVYSLGCTLYHLLTGNPPFAGPRYRTLTSLMEAHRSAPPPPIHEFNGRVGDELGAVVQRMLAKNPADRFATPGDVAEAIAPFARGANLAKLVAVALEEEGPAQTVDPTMHESPTTDPQVDEPRWRFAGPASGRLRRWKWTRWALPAAVFAAAAVVALAVREWRARALESQRLEVAQFALLVPGLNGSWWMDETPWLLPQVRATMAEALAKGSSGVPFSPKTTPYVPASQLKGVLDARAGIDVELVQNQLKELGNVLAAAGSRSVVDAFLAFREDDPESIDDEVLSRKLARLADRFEDGPGRFPSTAVDEHFRAVRAHKSAQWQAAEDAYERALNAFDQQSPTPLPAALCRADYGEMLYMRGEFEEAAVQFRAASASLTSRQNDFVEFLVYVKGREADCLRKLPESSASARELLDRAGRLAQRLPADHPLSAFLAERQAWLALDDWRVSEAVEHFEKAVRTRQKSAEMGNLRSKFFIFFDQQGLAMAERLRGREEEAQEYLESLSKSLAEALADEQRTSAKQRSQLRSRYLNTLERRADSAVYGPGRPEDALPVLRTALEFAKRNLDENGPLDRHIDRVRCKWILARAAGGEDASADLGLIEDEPSDTPLETKYRRLARAAVGLAAGEPGQAQAVADLVLGHSMELSSRDDAEFCFLACKLLYRFSDPNNPAAAASVRRTAQMANSIGRRSADPGVLRYLRPHYDSMIRWAAESDQFTPADVAHLIVESRQPFVAHFPDQLLAFHFAGAWGLVVDLDGVEAPSISRLPFGADQLHLARRDNDLRAALAREVPARIHARRKVLAPAAVYWSDLVRGVSDADFPAPPADEPDADPLEPPEPDAP
jgi:serine/threonine protein kinase